MRTSLPLVALAAGLAVSGLHARQESSRTMSDVRLMTVDPGHFHAALVQKEMYRGVDPKVDVYAPLSGDLYEHLKRIDAYNRRPAQPTSTRRRTTSSACSASVPGTSS
jgi:hypothetical protein